jgi:hypothetical protein
MDTESVAKNPNEVPTMTEGRILGERENKPPPTAGHSRLWIAADPLKAIGEGCAANATLMVGDEQARAQWSKCKS